MQTDVPPGRMSGGPVLQTEVTDAITNAFFEELAEVGYGRLSIDAVARRAGVGKAAIYRRWESKLDITVALTSDVAIAAIDVPDTGNLRDDIREYLTSGRTVLTHRLAQKIIPDLLAEAQTPISSSASICSPVPCTGGSSWSRPAMKTLTLTGWPARSPPP